MFFRKDKANNKKCFLRLVMKTSVLSTIGWVLPIFMNPIFALSNFLHLIIRARNASIFRFLLTSLIFWNSDKYLHAILVYFAQLPYFVKEKKRHIISDLFIFALFTCALL